MLSVMAGKVRVKLLIVELAELKVVAPELEPCSSRLPLVKVIEVPLEVAPVIPPKAPELLY